MDIFNKPHHFQPYFLLTSMDNITKCNCLCVNPYISHFNCGECGRVCPIERFCFWGMCAFEKISIAPLLSPSKIHYPTIPKE